MRFFHGPGRHGVRLGRWYLCAVSSDYRAYFSERNRIRCRVCPLPCSWRLVLRWDA